MPTNLALTAIENKTPDVSSLDTKTEYAIEITKIKNDYATTTALDARHKYPAQKTYFDAELKKVNDKVNSNSTSVLSYQHKLKQTENTINDLERDASYFRGKNYFTGEDGTQKDLVFQVSQKSFDSTWDQEGFWRSKGFFNQHLFFNHTNLIVLVLRNLQENQQV